MKMPFSCFVIYLFFIVNSLEVSEKQQPLWVDYTSAEICLLYSKLPDQKINPIRIPLKRIGNLFFIEAKINGLVGNFVLDIGAPYLVLNSTYFRDYEVDDNYYAGTLLSGTNYVRRMTIKDLNIHGLTYENLSADITDLGEIENKRGIKILGLLGIAMFKDYVFDLDVLKQQLILYDNLESVPIESKLILESPIRLNNNLISIEATLQDVKLDFSLDTGSETNIMDNNLSSKVYQGMRILKTSIIRDGNGAKTEAILALIDGISIEKIKLKKMTTLILNLETMSRAYNRKIDGMLGYPFFASGRVVIDFRNKRLFVYEFKNGN